MKERFFPDPTPGTGSGSGSGGEVDQAAEAANRVLDAYDRLDLTDIRGGSSSGGSGSSSSGSGGSSSGGKG